MALRFEEQLFLYLPEALRVSDTQELRALVETVTTWGEVVNINEDGTKQRGQLERTMRMFGLWFDRYRYILDSLGTFWDVDNVDIDFLPYLADYLGWELDRNLSPAEQRKVVRQAVYLYKIKGTRKAYTALFTALGFDVDIQEFEPYHMFRLNAIDRDNLNSLHIPNIEKLARQIEWMRPINALLLGLRFTKYLPEVFDDALQTWRGDTEFIGVTDFFEKYFIKRMEEGVGFLDAMKDCSIRAFFGDTGKALGQTLKHNGVVKYGEKFQYYTTNRLQNSEDLTSNIELGGIATVASGVDYKPPGAQTAWHLCKRSGITTSWYDFVITGTNLTVPGQTWMFTAFVTSGLLADANGSKTRFRIEMKHSGFIQDTFQFETSNWATNEGGWNRVEAYYTVPTTGFGGYINARVLPGYSPIVTGFSSIILSCPQLELVESGIKPNPSLYVATSGVQWTKTRHYPTVYSYDYPVISGHFPSEGMVIWLIRATDGVIISRTEVV